MTNREIFNQLMSAIGNVYGACGLMANMEAESGMKPTNVQNSYEKKIGMNDATYTQAVDKGTYTRFATDCVGYGFYRANDPEPRKKKETDESGKANAEPDPEVVKQILGDPDMLQLLMKLSKTLGK